MDRAQKQKVIYEFGLQDQVFTLGEFAGEDMDVINPIGQPLAEYGMCFEMIERLIWKLTEKLNRL